MPRKEKKNIKAQDVLELFEQKKDRVNMVIKSEFYDDLKAKYQLPNSQTADDIMEIFNKFDILKWSVVPGREIQKIHDLRKGSQFGNLNVSLSLTSKSKKKEL